MPRPTFLSFLGVGKEGTPGTPAVMTDTIAITTDPKSKDTITYLDDTAWRGSAVATYGKIAGVRVGETAPSGNVHVDTIGYFLQSVLPDVVVTGSAAPFTTAFAVKNTGDSQPVSYTLTDFDGINARQFAGAQLSELDIKFAADGLLTFDAKVVSWASVVQGGTPVQSVSSASPIASWKGAVQIGGVSSLVVMDGECNIKRAVTAGHTISGRQDPYRVFSGATSVDGKMTIIMEDDAELVRYLTNTQPALDFSFVQSTNASLQLHMSKAAYTVADVDRSADYVKLSVTYEGVANVTDVGATAGFSPVKATLVNAKPAGTYA